MDKRHLSDCASLFIFLCAFSPVKGSLEDFTIITSSHQQTATTGMNVIDIWCNTNDLPEAVIDSVYECFKSARGTRVGFNVNIDESTDAIVWVGNSVLTDRSKTKKRRGLSECSYHLSITICENEQVNAIQELKINFRSFQQEFTIQIKCENEVFPLSLTKNDVRRKVCQNEKNSSKRLSDCYRKEGIEIKDKEDEVEVEDTGEIKKMASLIVSKPLFCNYITHVFIREKRYSRH
jgi:hypothetical protein